MEKIIQSKKAFLILSVCCIVALVATLAACAPAADTEADKGQSAPSSEEPTKTVVTPEPDEFGVITAKAWGEVYPEIYASYEDNLDNAPGAEKHDYLELYPAINTLYAGFGFSKGYDEAAGHLYALESVSSTPRVGDATLANCLTCKSPQYTALVNENGIEEYAKPFADTLAMINEPISCYNCHENDVTSLTLTHEYFITAIGSDTNQVPMEAQVCGQCHNEYHFNPETKATTLPYAGLSEMSPEKMLAHYDDMGFSDWTYPGTDTPMLKVQHPEFETIYGGDTMSSMAKQGFSCSDCHMGSTTSDDGVAYTSHNWISPLENEELLESKCNTCHDDLKSEVAAWQEDSEARVQSISLKLEDMVNKVVEQVEAGTLSGDKLAELQTLHRSAQWYWDFVMVENSEGAHNPDFSNATLDKAEELVDQALAML